MGICNLTLMSWINPITKGKLMTGIIIPHYGDKGVLDRCYKSINKHIGKKEAQTKIESNNVINKGFTAAVNAGINHFRVATNASNLHSFDLIWVLNNDTEVLENALQPMIDRMISNKRCGIVSSKILFMDNPDRIHHGGTAQCWPNGIHKTGLRSLGQLNASTREKWVTFCSVLLKVEMIRQIGLLDERMFNFCSDADYCYRARYAGWEVWYEPKSEVLHSIGQSQKPDEEQQQVMFVDMLAFRDKWVGTPRFDDLDREVFESR